MRIAILDDYQSVALQSADWRSLGPGHEVTAFREHMHSEELKAKLHDFDCLVVMRERTPITAELLAALPRLRLLVTTGARNAVIDLEAASKHAVLVCGTNSVIHPTAELTWGLILALARNIVQEENGVRGNRWQVMLGCDLKGKTLGIAGLGNLGVLVAKVGTAFGMRVIAWSQNIEPAKAAEHGAIAVTKEELLAHSDVVSVHLVLGERSRGLFGFAEFEAMKRSALFINTSRAQIVQQQALVHALQAKLIRGAAIDVFEEEPLPMDSPMRRLPNLILSPHVGYATQESYRIYFGDAVEDISAWIAGRPIRVLNGPAGAGS